MKHKVLTGIFITLAANAHALTAHAADIPAEGKIAVSYTSTATSVPRTMPIGGGREFVVQNQAMTAVNEAGNPVMNHMGGRCQYSRLTDPQARTFELHGYCTYTDSDGDMIFEQFEFLPGSAGRGKFIGGTGKFTGLQGEIEITVASAKSVFEGITQAIGRKTGSYRIIGR